MWQARRAGISIVMLLVLVALASLLPGCATPAAQVEVPEVEAGPATEAATEEPTPEPTDEPTAAPTDEPVEEDKGETAGAGRSGKGAVDRGPAAQPAEEAGGEITLTVINDLGQDVCYIFISSPTEDRWGDDWLGGQEILRDGQQREITLDAGEWDVMAADCDQSELSVDYGAVFTQDAVWRLSKTEVSGPPPDGDIPFTVTNSSRTELCFVYLSPTSADNWGRDWLGSETIPPGSSYTFYVTAGEWDLLARDCESNALGSAMGIDVEGGDRLDWELTDDGFVSGLPQGDATLTVVNNLTLDVCYLYISPSTSDEWGADWLGTEVLRAGNTVTYTLAAGVYDLTARDCSGETLVERYGEALSGEMEWEIFHDAPGGAASGTASVTFVNRTSEPVCYVWFGPPQSEWYGDALGTMTISGWGSMQVSLPQEPLVLQAEDCSGVVMMRAEGFQPVPGAVWEINP